MCFQLTIHHMPGMNMRAADALSRAPVSNPKAQQTSQQEEVEHYVTEVVACLPCSAEQTNVYRLAQLSDPITSVMHLKILF